MQITINKLEKSEVEILGVLPQEDFAKYEDKALIIIGDRLELPGFRKGKAPASIVKENVTDMMILEEMAEQALSSSYPKIIEDNKIDAIGRPQITITKIARGENLEFKIKTAVLPEMNLPDYKAIAKEQKAKPEFNVAIEVDEKEVDKTILDLRKMKAEQSLPPHDHKEGESEEEHAAAHKEIPESEYPAFDETFVKSFGDFATTDAFREKIRQNLKIEKETEQKDKLRMSIVEDLLKGTTGEIPEILIESEIDKMVYRLQADITNMGFNFDDYLMQIKKTEAELRGQWREDAEKRAKLQLIIHNISDKENLKPTPEEMEKEVNTIMSMYKDADISRAQAYVENMMENEKVFKFLENQ